MNETTMISLRIDNSLLSKIDAYCNANPIFSRSYFISRLVDAVLKTADEDRLFFILSVSRRMLDGYELQFKEKLSQVLNVN